MITNYFFATISPDMVKTFVTYGMIGKAQRQQLVKVGFMDLTSYNIPFEGKVYGGGPGRVLAMPPILTAIKQFKTQFPQGLIVCPSPAAPKFTAQCAKKLVGNDLLFICGRYQGIDYRLNQYIDLFFSIGDYVISCGEIGSCVILDSIIRYIPKVMNNKYSLSTDNEHYPVYTKPANYLNHKVPQEFISGNHQKIKALRQQLANQRIKNEHNN